MPRQSRSSTTKHGHLYRLAAWTRASKAFRSTPEGALCADCLAIGRTSASQCVDHDPPHNGNVAMFWDRSTWRPLCWRCHSSKSRSDASGRPHRLKGCDATGRPLDPADPWHCG